MPPFFTFSELLSQIQRRNPQFRLRLLEGRLLQLWPSLVGETIGKQAEAVRVQDRVLWLAIKHPVWKSELLHRKAELLKRLNDNIQKLMEFSGEEHPYLKDLAFMDSTAHESRTDAQQSGRLWIRPFLRKQNQNSK